jgi:hypothetical protein
MVAFPATIMTAMVSPTARPIDRIAAARMPDLAAGRTTILTACQGVAPTASIPSLYAAGTARSAS